MKRLLAVLFMLLSIAISAQIFDPVDWEFSQERISDSEIQLKFKASIEDNWYLYSQHINDDGPVATEFTFNSLSGYELIGEINEGEPLEEFDPNFDMVLKYFKNEAVFSQKIKVTSAEDFQIEGNVYFMVCDEAQCLPPAVVDFSFNIEGVDNGESISETSGIQKEKGMWGLFFIAFLSGFAALLTPCVFPMIPMTVSFFTKQSKNKAKGIVNAIIYGISIIVIYVALGVGVSSVFGADSLNNMATNVYFNIGFFLLLIIFAASFLGAFGQHMRASSYLFE